MFKLQINLIPCFHKDVHLEIPEAPILLNRCSLLLQVLVCSVCLQPICEQTNHMPVMSVGWCAPLNSHLWEKNLLLPDKTEHKQTSRIVMHLAKRSNKYMLLQEPTFSTKLKWKHVLTSKQVCEILKDQENVKIVRIWGPAFSSCTWHTHTHTL
jgi:hypothetical protein